MKMPGPAVTCLLIGAIGGVLLLALGETTTAIAIFVVEAVAWGGLYLFAAPDDERLVPTHWRTFAG